MDDKLNRYLGNKSLEELGTLRGLVSSICRDYDNSLVNRDWDTLNIGFPNISMKLELRSIQLLTKLLEEYTLYDQKYTSLLDKCKERLAELYKTTYYKD